MKQLNLAINLKQKLIMSLPRNEISDAAIKCPYQPCSREGHVRKQKRHIKDDHDKIVLDSMI